MTYLLDTDTFSNLARNHARVELRYMLVGKAATCISTVTVNEIEYGRSLHPDKVKRHNARINALLGEIPALPFDFDDACTTGRIRAALTPCRASLQSGSEKRHQPPHDGLTVL